MTDLRDPADSEDEDKMMTMTTQTPDNVSTIEDGSNSRWLAARLAPARARVAVVPTDEAVDRIRARVFGEAAARKKVRKIAA